MATRGISILEVVGWAALVAIFVHDWIVFNPGIGIATLFGFLVGIMFDLRFSVLLVCLLLLAARRRMRKEPTATNGDETVIEAEERRREVCKLWKQRGPEVWQAETGPLNFYLWLTKNRPELLPPGPGDCYQRLRGELGKCADA